MAEDGSNAQDVKLYIHFLWMFLCFINFEGCIIIILCLTLFFFLFIYFMAKTNIQA